MPKIYHSILLLLFLLGFTSNAQKKKLQAKSIVGNITIDGKLDEDDWKNASIASDFVMFEPDNGKPISDSKKTEVKVLYDNNALYIAAVLLDDEPNKISNELTNRDVFGFSDIFSVSINGFNDGQQDYKFYVSAAGVQSDCIATEAGEDLAWDAIWESKSVITDSCWMVEMKIPYAALRFSNSKKQTWGLNFMRDIKRTVQKFTWNLVDTKIGAVITQTGILEGIENIKPPTRLFFIPYLSEYYQQEGRISDRTFKAGLDIKYGINDAFTLDAILVPDFGQTKFDNYILNTRPFEQQFDENRPFFTEGTDLFSIGNLFYSRRIGGSPSTVPEFDDTVEDVAKYPSSVDLINAVKVSGRTEKGLGIGVLNAVTEKTLATISKKSNNETREVVVEPLTNYNIFVLDQRFNQNSSVSFVNTNTTRNGSFRDANVSALVFDLNTKANTYNLYGDFKYSAVNSTTDLYGYKSGLNFAKTSGKFRYLVSGRYVSEDYDINDLGIIFYTNYHGGNGEMSYRIVNPTKVFNTFKITQEFGLEIQNTTGKPQEAWTKIYANASTLKNHNLGAGLQINPVDRFDFYEPREFGSYLYIPKSVYGYLQFFSNENKPFNYYFEAIGTQFEPKQRNTVFINGGAKYRFNEKFSLSYGFEYENYNNEIGGFGDDLDDSNIVLGQRNREVLLHKLTGKYSITNKMNINLSTRYYWSYSQNNSFFNLQNNGYLTPNTAYSENQDLNVNSWNFDLSYSWWFAPGSEFTVLYRNYGVQELNSIEKSIKTNFKNVFDSDLTSIFSVSLRYFIDYNKIKSKR
ncbi:MAG: carbohydrate binding family 9 domain-containing protein [Flavobacterium sp.]|nr:carbohydrate binding family 9 domain-containing protein [Flavobacterium sp.]